MEPSTLIDRDDVIALLEAGPEQPAQLASWLRQPLAAVRRVLRAMERDGLVAFAGDGCARLSGQMSAVEPIAPPVVIPPPVVALEPARPVSPERQRELDQFEVTWTPHRDAPSLTGGAAGLGASLSGVPFSVSTGRRSLRTGQP